MPLFVENHKNMRETPGPFYSKHPLTNNTHRQRVQFYKGNECDTAKLRVLLKESKNDAEIFRHKYNALLSLYLYGVLQNVVVAEESSQLRLLSAGYNLHFPAITFFKFRFAERTNYVACQLF